MHRNVNPIFIIIAFIGLIGATQLPMAFAQDGIELTDHPLVGTWLLAPNEGDGDPNPNIVTFGADGITTYTTPGGTTGNGTWEATGDNTGIVTWVFLLVDGDMGRFIGNSKIRGTVTVDASEERWTMNYNIEHTTPDGSSRFVGEDRNILLTVEATHIEAEPPA